VDGLIRAAAPEVPAASTYFLGHSTPNTWTTFTSTAARIMRVKPRTVRLPLQAALGIGYCADIWSHLMRLPVIISRDKIAEAQCRFWVCDSRRAKAELGWEASTSLESGLAETLAWYRGAGWIRY
jgi:nucleoside-diphosphate-sugar epimerase